MARPPLARGFVLELDGLRGIAILLVMVHRFWPRTATGVAADVAGAGWIGVDLFFVISGFLIAGILLDTKGEPGYLKNFYARRVLRIFPLYYLFVIGVFVAFSGNPEFREGAGSPLWYLFHLGNIPEGVLDNPVPYWLAPVWSLAIEEQFYLTFPWIVRWLDPRRLTILLVSMIAAAPVIRLVTMLAFPDQERVQYLFTLCRIDAIAVGCLLAVIARSVDVERWRSRAMLVASATIPAVVVLGVASGLERTSPFDRVFGYSLVATGCACVVAIVVMSRDRPVTAILRWAPLAYLGKLCFGLYLLHRPADTLVSAAAARLGLEGDLRLMPAKLAVAVILATLSWHVLERRFLRLKDRFASDRHPAARMLGAALLICAVSCTARVGYRADDAHPHDVVIDPADAIEPPDAMIYAPPDAAPPAGGKVLYVEGPRHSPITPALSARLQAIAAPGLSRRVFAKVGDSITVAADFLYCFDGSFDLGGHDDLAATIASFQAGDAGGTSPFSRVSLAARGGTTAADMLAGDPCSLEAELSAIAPRIAVVMLGSNEIRYGWTFDAAGTQLLAMIDQTIARGTIPILSTIPANVGYPEADARISGFNRVVRAIAQGRGVPLVDLHRALAPLPNRGISSDGLHPSTAPAGGCVLTAAGLQYGYNVRNLATLEALARVDAALDGAPSNTTAPTRAGNGLANDPFIGTLPLVDLATTTLGASAVANHGCGAPSTGHEVSYRITLAQSTEIEAFVIDPAGVDVDVYLIDGPTCVSGDAMATATVGPGPVDIVVDARNAGSEGDFILVVQSR